MSSSLQASGRGHASARRAILEAFASTTLFGQKQLQRGDCRWSDRASGLSMPLDCASLPDGYRASQSDGAILKLIGVV